MSYSFLSQPPQVLPKKRVIPAALPVPLCSPPPVPLARRRSKSGSFAYAHIHQWAAQIQPGSPAPCSPSSPRSLILRRPSLTSTSSSSARRPSFSSGTRLPRRPSISHTRATSGSLNYLVHTPRSVSAGATSPTSNPNAEYPDLTAMGYTSVFIHFDKTPTTPSPFRAQCTQGGVTPLTGTFDISSISIPEVKAKKVGMKRFKSFGILRSKKPALSSSPTRTSHSKSSRARTRPMPPTLANELELMQFIDGGSINAHAKRVMQDQAKGAGSDLNAHKGPGGAGVGAVYRDGKGGIWWDADEQMEYAPLLVEDAKKREEGVDELRWEEFASASPLPVTGTVNMNMKPLVHPAVTSLSISALERRESTTSTSTSTSTTHSSLHPHNLLPLPEHLPPPSFSHGEIDDRALSSIHFVGTATGPAPKMALLSLPSRPRRKVAHLMREPGMSSYVVGVEAFGGTKSPLCTSSPKAAIFASMQSSSNTKEKKTRPRPAPLKLTVSALVRAEVAVRGVVLAQSEVKMKEVVKVEAKVEGDAKKEFIEDSFVPLASLPPPAAVPAVPAAPPSSRTRTPTRTPGTLPRRPALQRLPPIPITQHRHKPLQPLQPLERLEPLDVSLVAPWTQLSCPPAPCVPCVPCVPLWVERSSTETTTSCSQGTTSQPKSVRLLGLFGRK